MPPLASNRSLSTLARMPWDLLIVGGGITGAGIFHEAVCRGLRVLLVEQNDFASGTSSRSSKLVHGGLHYLKRFQIRLAHDAIRSRERMATTMAGLVQRTDILLPTFTDDRMPPPWQVSCLLSAYDLLAGRVHFHRPRQRDAARSDFSSFTPLLSGAFCYGDASTDDARLVLHVLREGCQRGGYALHYTAASVLLRDELGNVKGVRLIDRDTGSSAEVHARVVVNATGPWADRLRVQLDKPPKVRLIRGSHLIFPGRKLPVHQAIATLDPVSHRPIYFIPWQGVTLVGSTALEHSDSMDTGPRITPFEAAYLFQSASEFFPTLNLERSDIQATFAGVRPIVDQETDDPGEASREEAMWTEDGLLTVTGGKLTTFRSTARRVMKAMRKRLPELDGNGPPVLAAEPSLPRDLPFDTATSRTMLARYGAYGLASIADAAPEERRPVTGSGTCRAELRWIVRTEAVRHLDDLLLRRLRIGLTTPDGGLALLDHLRPSLQCEIGWSDAQWDSEVERYATIWRQHHGVPDF